jgi:hypothetical protein
MEAPQEQSDADLFCGLGVVHRNWFGTLTLDRFNAQMTGGSYYRQALRLGVRQAFRASQVSLQGNLQRVDPVIRQTPHYWGGIYGRYDRFLGEGMALGLQAYWSLSPANDGASSRFDIGPILRIQF